MSAERVRQAEDWLGWPQLPPVPLRFRAVLATAGRALADYVEGDSPARRRLADALDEVVSHPRFGISSSAFRVAILTRAGIAHNWCGVGDTSDEELSVARMLLTGGLSITSLGGREQAWLEYGLANTLVNLYQRNGEEGLLDDALRHARHSVTCAGGDRRLAALCRAGLASILDTRFRAHGDMAVLAEAVAHAERSVAMAGDTQLGHRFTYILADALSKRYDTTGSLDDLNRAIELLRKASDSRDYIMSPRTGNAFRGTLGSLLRRLYLRTGDVAVLDEAIGLLMEEVADDDSRADPVSLSLLGNALLTRYESFGNRDDLLRAVDLQLKTLSARGAGDWQLASGHNNVGNALAAAWRATGDERLGEQAVVHYRTALSLTSRHAPERASRAYNLGTTLQARCESGGGNKLAIEAVTAYEDAVRHGLDTSLEWALAAARRWGAWATARGCWDEACAAYTHALEATQRLVRIQLLRQDKETWLADSQGVPSEAAYALFRAGRLEEAVVALETGRSQLLSESLEADRIGIGRLADAGRADLVDRYRAAVGALEEAMRGGVESAALRRLRQAVEDVIAELRSVDGYERFLTQPRFADVRQAIPRDGVIVYVAAAGPAGVALAVGDNGRIGAVELPMLTTEAVDRRVRVLLGAGRGSAGQSRGSWKGALDAATRWAWSAIVSHVLQIIDEKDDLIIVPCGKLAMMPLHAAWRPVPGSANGRHYLLDERTVRYVPNARALEVTRRVADRTPCRRIAVVADPQPTSWPRVGYARAEAAWARRWFPENEVLRGTEANRAAVTEALLRAQVHHFICHGRYEMTNPLNSALLLAGDQALTLREILGLRLGDNSAAAGARLTVLSACDTDRPGAALPDEVISLPSGLIQAGVAGVVASQWAVRSEATSLLMARFYQLWRTEALEPVTALRIAQRWLRDTTNQEKIRDLTPAMTPTASQDEDLEGLVRSLRLRDPDARPYTHPADWAGMSYHGA
ncbi:CHAT domain-containing protein [Streptomyces sp. MN13]